MSTNAIFSSVRNNLKQREVLFAPLKWNKTLNKTSHWTQPFIELTSDKTLCLHGLWQHEIINICEDNVICPFVWTPTRALYFTLLCPDIPKNDIKQWYAFVVSALTLRWASASKYAIITIIPLCWNKQEWLHGSNSVLDAICDLEW